MWVHTKWKFYQKENACVLTAEQLQTQLDWLRAILVETPHPERGSGDVCTETVGFQEIPIPHIVCIHTCTCTKHVHFENHGLVSRV